MLNAPNTAREEMQHRVMVRISLSEDEEAGGMDGFCA